MAGGAGGAAQVGVGALQLVNAKHSADAIKRQAEFEAKQQEFNAELSTIQQQEVKAVAQKDIDRRYQDLRQMTGAQKVALASQGIEVEGELGDQLAQDEEMFARQDVEAIKNNAWREAMGLEIQARNLQSQASFTRVAGRDRARSTLATGGLQAANTMIQGGSSIYKAYS